MKKRLLSLLLVLAVVFSFSLSAFATDTGIDIIDDPLSYYFENQMLGVQKGTGVTLVCPKCDYKVVYTGGTLVTCPYDGEALVLADLAGVHAEKVPSGIGRKDLPGYIDNSGTAHVSKEGKLKFVAHPCWLDVGEQESNKFTLTDPYKPYRVQEEDEDYGLYVYDWLGYNNGISHFSLYTQPLSDDMYYGNFDFYWIIDSGFVPGTYYVAADQPTVKNFYSKYGAEPQILKTKAGEYNLPNDSYWGLGNLSLGCSVCWLLWASFLPVFVLSRNVLTLGGGFVDLHSCRCRLLSALAVSRRSLCSDASLSLHLLYLPTQAPEAQ